MFLAEPPHDEGVERVYAADRESDGYVQNLTRLWAWRPDVLEAFAALRGLLMAQSTLRPGEFATLVTATARTIEDSYCALAWGARLAEEVGEETAAQLISSGEAQGLTVRQRALARWAARVLRGANAITPADVDALREGGLTEREVFEATAFVALRAAFSMVNDALGAAPDRALADDAPAAVRQAVTFGRPPSGAGDGRSA